MRTISILIICMGVFGPCLSKVGPKIILKLDDFQAKKDSCPCIPTLNFLMERQIKAGFGAVANKFDSTALSVLRPYLNATNTKGENLFEIWHHGLNHAKTEFKDSTYQYQKVHFEQADKLVKKYLDIQMHTFGTPYNASDSITNQVVSEDPNYKVFLYSSIVPKVDGGIFYMDHRVNMENGTGKPEFEFFKSDYQKNKDRYTDYMVLQGHPNGWTPEKLDQFRQIIDFLISEGCEFVLPYEFYLDSVKSKHVPGNGDLKQLVIRNVQKGTIEQAGKMMSENPVTVTASSCKRSSGGKNDFYSEGDYWWPDPAKPDGPYIQKDGQTNPENFSDHRYAMIRFSDMTSTLTSAWLLTGNRKYADKAIEHMNAWFVDPSTKMNPNMLYAQAIWGKFTGRGIGLIDAYHLVEVAQSAKLLIDNKLISKEESSKIKQWFSSFLTWMTTHQYGIDEMNAKNNHGTCWVATAASMAVVAENVEVKNLCINRFKTILLPSQMADDGSFPLEIKRTKPYGYSLFNIDAMCNVARILSTPEDNLFEFKTEKGLSLKNGMEYIYPFISDKSKWPFAKDIYIWEEWPVRQSSLLFAGLAYQKENYISTFLSLPANPTHPEVIRNLPVRHPIIWLMNKPSGNEKTNGLN